MEKKSTAQPTEKPKAIVKKEEPKGQLPPVMQRVADSDDEFEDLPKPKSVEALRPAIPTEIAKDLVSTRVLKTTSKFCCGRWFKLVTGKMITANAHEIAYLRTHGLVE
jgi:hypothetical protein